MFGLRPRASELRVSAPAPTTESAIPSTVSTIVITRIHRRQRNSPYQQSQASKTEASSGRSSPGLTGLSLPFLGLLLSSLPLLPCFTFPSLLLARLSGVLLSFLFPARLSLSCRCGLSLARLSLSCRCGLSLARLSLPFRRGHLSLSFEILDLSNLYEALMAANDIWTTSGLMLNH